MPNTDNCEIENIYFLIFKKVLFEPDNLIINWKQFNRVSRVFRILYYYPWDQTDFINFLYAIIGLCTRSFTFTIFSDSTRTNFIINTFIIIKNTKFYRAWERGGGYTLFVMLLSCNGLRGILCSECKQRLQTTYDSMVTIFWPSKKRTLEAGGWHGADRCPQNEWWL